MRACSFAKLVIAPSNATISPSAMKEVVFCREIASTTSGYFTFSRIRFREKDSNRDHGEKRGSAPHPIFGSNNHPCREKHFIRECRQHGRNPARLGRVR